MERRRDCSSDSTEHLCGHLPWSVTALSLTSCLHRTSSVARLGVATSLSGSRGVPSKVTIAAQKKSGLATLSEEARQMVLKVSDEWIWWAFLVADLPDDTDDD